VETKTTGVAKFCSPLNDNTSKPASNRIQPKYKITSLNQNWAMSFLRAASVEIVAG